MKRGLFGPGEKYDNESGITNNKWQQVGYVAVIEFQIFFNDNKKFMVAGKKLG